MCRVVSDTCIDKVKGSTWSTSKVRILVALNNKSRFFIENCPLFCCWNPSENKNKKILAAPPSPPHLLWVSLTTCGLQHCHPRSFYVTIAVVLLASSWDTCRHHLGRLGHRGDHSIHEPPTTWRRISFWKSKMQGMRKRKSRCFCVVHYSQLAGITMTYLPKKRHFHHFLAMKSGQLNW